MSFFNPAVLEDYLAREKGNAAPAAPPAAARQPEQRRDYPQNTATRQASNAEAVKASNHPTDEAHDELR
jgi:hypothetical protein